MGPVPLIRHTRADHRFLSHLRPREASEASRSTAIVSAAAPLPLPHMYVRISARTQGWHPPAYHALQAVARTRHTMMARSRAASMGSRGGPAHKIAARSLRRDRAALSRARQQPHRPAPACRRAYNVAAARQALAATICQRTQWMVLSAPINNPEVASCLGGTHGGLLRLAVAKHSVIVESDVVVGRRSRHRADVLGRRPQGPDSRRCHQRAAPCPLARVLAASSARRSRPSKLFNHI